MDAEQWKTLGEGAAYRVVGPLGRLQSGRTKLQVGKPQAGAGELKLSVNIGTFARTFVATGDEKPGFNEPLHLRMVQELDYSEIQRVSRIEGRVDEVDN